MLLSLHVQKLWALVDDMLFVAFVAVDDDLVQLLDGQIFTIVHDSLIRRRLVVVGRALFDLTSCVWHSNVASPSGLFLSMSGGSAIGARTQIVVPPCAIVVARSGSEGTSV